MTMAFHRTVNRSEALVFEIRRLLALFEAGSELAEMYAKQGLFDLSREHARKAHDALWRIETVVREQKPLKLPKGGPA